MEQTITTEQKFMTIPRGLLLHVYWILPVLLGVVLYDMHVLDYKLYPYLGIDGLFLPLFILLFHLPHVIASFFSFFDKEYAVHYKKYLFGYLPLLLMGTIWLLYQDYLLGLVIYLLFDMWHGVKQKVGIALILGAKPDWVHRAWTLLAFFIAAVAYVFIIRPDAYPQAVLPYLSPLMLAGVALFFLSMLAMIWRSAPKVRWYIFNVSILFFLSYFFILAGYLFFAILAFRFVHDVSAFAFYVTHDNNRKRDGQKNWLYSTLSAIPLPTLIITPALGLLFAYLINGAAEGVVADYSQQVAYSIVVLLGMSHFYMEGVMWKRGSPHRRHVRVE